MGRRYRIELRSFIDMRSPAVRSGAGPAARPEDKGNKGRRSNVEYMICDRLKEKIVRCGVIGIMTLLFVMICGCEVRAGMNLETEAAVSGISVALNNYYARTMKPEEALAESVSLVANDAIVVTEETTKKTTHAVQKLVEDVTPEEEEIVKEGEGGLTWGTVKGTASLRLRDKPSADAKTLTLLAEGEHYIVTGQEGQFLKIQVDDDLEGYVFKDYIDTSISYDDELALERAKLAAQAEQAKKEAAEALKKLEEVKKSRASGETAKAAETAAKAEETTAKATEKAAETTKAETTKGETTKAETADDDAKPQETVEELNWGDDDGDDSDEETEAVEAPDFDEEMSEQEETEEAGEDDWTPDETVASGGGTGPGGVTDATRTAMVAYAKQFLGNPYVYGGTSLTEGCDCSGFTQAIYSYFGMSIGRSSRDQAAKGTSISPSDAQPGDLFFYDSSGTINHVAMYIGGGQVIHSSSSATGIKISNAYYRTPCRVCTYF